VWAHGWLLFDAEKMSKSRGNVVRPRPIAQVMGIEPLRYFLLREVVFGQDGNFSYDALINRYNSDLANGLGNLASRTLTMIGKYFGGEIPAAANNLDNSESVMAAAEFTNAALAEIGALYDRFSFSLALERIWELIATVDKFITEQKPWALAEDAAQRGRLATVLYGAAEGLRIIAALAHPVLPHATEKIWQQLGLREPLSAVQWDSLCWGQLKAGARAGKPEAIFPRLDKKETIERIEAMENEPQKPAATPAGAPATTPPAAGAAGGAPGAAAPARIAIDDFLKVEMRVGQVKTAERVAGADKLLKLMVDIGDEVRQIVAGIATVYKPEDLVGRKVAVVVNLQPRKLRGVESNGMILAASAGPEGSPVLAGFLEDVPVGARLK